MIIMKKKSKILSAVSFHISMGRKVYNFSLGWQKTMGHRFDPCTFNLSYETFGSAHDFNVSCICGKLSLNSHAHVSSLGLEV